MADEPLRASIWGRTIAAEPFDKSPFQEIRIPEWVHETVGVGYTLSVQNAEQRQRAVKAGVTISEMNFVDPFHVFYDSRLLKRRSPHVAADSVDKEVAEYRRLGLRILGVYPPTLQSEVYTEHPDWRRTPTNTTEVPQVDLKQYNGNSTHTRAPCPFCLWRRCISSMPCRISLSQMSSAKVVSCEIDFASRSVITARLSKPLEWHKWHI